MARAADEGVIEVQQDGPDAYVVRVRTDPPVAVPPHVLAALEAAGCRPDALADGRVEVRIAMGVELQVATGRDAPGATP